LLSVRFAGLCSGQQTNLPAGVDAMTKPVAGPDSSSSVVLISEVVGSDPKSNSYEESE
jgi:hypothetical protein